MDVNTSKQNAEKIIVTIFTGEKIVKLVSLAMFGTLGKIKKSIAILVVEPPLVGRDDKDFFCVFFSFTAGRAFQLG